MKTLSLLSLVVLCHGALGHAKPLRTPALSTPFSEVAAGTVFSKSTPLQLHLTAPFKVLLDYKDTYPNMFELKEKSISGTLSYVEPINGVNTRTDLPVEIHFKGNLTLMTCPFPKLELGFKAKDTKNTIFDGIKSVDLNTHCGEESELNNQNIHVITAGLNSHREALVYRMMDVLQIPGLKGRSAWVQYSDPSPGARPFPKNDQFYQALLVEDMGAFRKRLDVKEIKAVHTVFKDYLQSTKPNDKILYTFQSVQSSPTMDHEDAARVELFQWMIGNSDWFLKVNPNHIRPHGNYELWNVKVIELQDGKWIPVPQDFNFTAVVLGSQYEDETSRKAFDSLERSQKDKVKNVFLENKKALYDLLEPIESDVTGRENTRFLLDRFFKKLDTL